MSNVNFGYFIIDGQQKMSLSKHTRTAILTPSHDGKLNRQPLDF